MLYDIKKYNAVDAEEKLCLASLLLLLVHHWHPAIMVRPVPLIMD